MQDLVGAGLLEPAARGRLSIGCACSVSPARPVRCGADRWSPRPFGRRQREHGAAFFLSRLRGRAVEIIHVETPDTGVSFLHPGLGKRPLHACSCAKAVAAVSPAQLGTAQLAGRLRAYTEATLTRPEDLEADLARVRKRGYAECVEEIERGMCSVAVPLGRTGPDASISIGATGSTRVFTPAFREWIGERLVDMARDLSADPDRTTAKDLRKSG